MVFIPKYLWSNHFWFSNYIIIILVFDTRDFLCFQQNKNLKSRFSFNWNWAWINNYFWVKEKFKSIFLIQIQYGDTTISPTMNCSVTAYLTWRLGYQAPKATLIAMSVHSKTVKWDLVPSITIFSQSWRTWSDFRLDCQVVMHNVMS
mgnify:CR=1 FL=1